MKRRGPLALGVALIALGVGFIGMGPVRTAVSDQSALARAETLTEALEQEWEETRGTGAKADPVQFDKTAMSRPLGKGFAFIYIPRLGPSWRSVVVEGVDQPDLEGAVGHFPGTADPGMLGNFALAGHRNMDGSLFGNLDEVSKGDKIIVETRTRWITYTVTGSSIVAPTDVEVIAPVPFDEQASPDKAVITLTTCHPWWSSAQRLVLFGKLSETRLKTMGPPKDLPAKSLRS
jgi:sortase A